MRTVLAPFGTCTLNSFVTWNDACFGCGGLETSPPNAPTEIPVARLAATNLKKMALIRTCRECMASFLVQIGAPTTNVSNVGKEIGATTDRRRGI
jgi:hypothetical protein